MAMVGAMAKTVTQRQNDDLVQEPDSNAEALGKLYELYYEQVFRFCVHRLFSRSAAEDVTSTVFLHIARQFRRFAGRTQADFRNWLYAVAANQTNAYIRKTSRRKRLLAEAAASIRTDSSNEPDRLDWPSLYAAILKLKPNQQTVVTLRFFENMEFEQISRILNRKETTVRVTLHRALKNLRDHLQNVLDREQ